MNEKYMETQNKNLVISDPENPNLKWYILGTASNSEWKAIQNLNEQLKLSGMDKKVKKIICPTIKELSINKGKKTTKYTKVFPSYLFIFAEMDLDLCSLILRTNKIAKFISSKGSEGIPSSVSDKEIEKIFNSILKSDFNLSPYKEGDEVRIETGSFFGFNGHIKRIDTANKQLIVSVFILGKNTDIPLSFGNVTKI